MMSEMWDLIIRVALPIHIGGGVLAALMVFPLQIFLPKQAFHRRLGRWAVWLTVVIAASGAALLLSPMFSQLLNIDLGDLTLGAMSFGADSYRPIFANQTTAPLFFIWLDAVLLYLVVTGAGTWNRLARGSRTGGYPPRTVDVIATIAVVAVTLVETTIALHDLHGNPVFARLILTYAPAIFIVAGLDVWTWTGGGRGRRWWWLLHALKLLEAWRALLFAVLLRYALSDQQLAEHEGLILRAVTLGGLVAIALYGVRNVRRPAHPSHRA